MKFAVLIVGTVMLRAFAAPAEQTAPQPPPKRAWLACYKTDGCLKEIQLGNNAVLRCPKMDDGEPDVPNCKIDGTIAMINMRKARIELR